MTDFSKIEGTLAYVCVQRPAKSYVDPAAKVKEEPGFEWKASVIVTDEEYVDELEEHLKETKGKGISIKKVKSVDFESKYRIPAPEGAGKNVWVLTLRKSTTLGRTGKEVPEQYRPKIYQRIKKTLLDITHDAEKQVANGSKGVLSVDYFNRDNGNVQWYLKNVLVTDLIVYTPQENEYEPGSEFEDDDSEEVEAPVAPAKPVKELPKKEKPANKAPKTSDGTDDIPF